MFSETPRFNSSIVHNDCSVYVAKSIEESCLGPGSYFSEENEKLRIWRLSSKPTASSEAITHSPIITRSRADGYMKGAYSESGIYIYCNVIPGGESPGPGAYYPSHASNTPDRKPSATSKSGMSAFDLMTAPDDDEASPTFAMGSSSRSDLTRCSKHLNQLITGM